MSEVREFTVSITSEHTYREGWSVHVEPMWASDEDDEPTHIESIEVDVVHIFEDAVQVIGGAACIATEMGWVPVENFADVPDLDVGDTHDLRCRWFATEPEARQHAAYTRKRFEHPSPWESFVQL